MMGGAQPSLARKPESIITNKGVAAAIGATSVGLHSMGLSSSRDGAHVTLAGLGGAGVPFRLPNIAGSM